MRWLSSKVLHHKKTVLILSLLMALVCAGLMTQVKINYNLSDYLPSDAPSTRALEILSETAGGGLPNLQVCLPAGTVGEALEYKEKLRNLQGVTGVLWLDDVSDAQTPLAMLDESAVAQWYSGGSALYQLTVPIERSAKVVEAVREAFPDAILAGEALNQSQLMTVSMGEIGKIMLYVIPLTLLILLLSTGSWFEPLLFLAAIGVAILLNEGTNIFLGEISYVTQACSAVLQLAVSIDYAVFLLRRFTQYRDEGLDSKEAMKLAMRKGASSIAASALTTVCGFLALMLMRFRMGADMGIVLAKGVIFSFLSVMIFLPALAIACEKWIVKTRHRALFPKVRNAGKIILRLSIPIAVVAALALAPAYLAQDRNAFIYGSSGMHAEESEVRKSAREISSRFGNAQQMALLVPQGEPGREKELTQALSQIENMTSVTSYSSMVGAEIPSLMLSSSQSASFSGGGYARLYLYADTDEEGETAFALVEKTRAVASEYYDEYYLTGQNVINYDLKETITADNQRVLLAAVISIFIILLFTFRGLVAPLLLVLTIEGAIWINMAWPYFTGASLNYIGYQIVSAVQLGATVDYGILLTQKYLEARGSLGRMDAAADAFSQAKGSIIPPSLILILAGSLLFLISTNGVISQMGAIIARGAAVSAAMVLLFLPPALAALDPLIRLTTLKRKEKKNA